MATKLTIGFLGAGKIATALARGFIRAEIVFPREIIASDVARGLRRFHQGNRRQNRRVQLRRFEIRQRPDSGRET